MTSPLPPCHHHDDRTGYGLQWMTTMAQADQRRNHHQPPQPTFSICWMSPLQVTIPLGPILNNTTTYK